MYVAIIAPEAQFHVYHLAAVVFNPIHIVKPSVQEKLLTDGTQSGLWAG